jgi:hypothetical protein
MAICPKHGCKIDYLINIVTKIDELTFKIDSCAKYDLIDLVSDVRQIYLCPKCREVIANYGCEAINFLRGSIVESR